MSVTVNSTHLSVVVTTISELVTASIGSPPAIKAVIIEHALSDVTGADPITSTGGLAPIIGIMPATPASAGSMSAVDKTKLDAITGTNTGDQVIPTTLPASDVYAWAKEAVKPSYTATEVGLSNVDNTSDVNKPVSIAQAAADSAVQSTAASDATTKANAAQAAAALDATAKASAAQVAAASDATTKANAAQAAAIAASTPLAHVGTGGTAHAVAGTSAGFMSASDKTKLDAITGSNTGDETTATIKSKLSITTLSGNNTGDQVIPTTLPASDVYAWAKTAVKPSYTKSEVGLGNVDNTSDANKPVSSATQTALNLKADLASPTFTGSVAGITKTMVGLSNVDNTSDANKPVSTAQATADSAVQTAAASDATTKANAAQAAAIAASAPIAHVGAGEPAHAKAIAGGAAGFMSGLDKLKLDNITGTNTGDQVIPTTLPASDVYAWAKAATKPAYTKSEVGLSNVDNTSDADKPISSATQTALNAKQDTLVSATNIKTVNGSSLLGAGDIIIEGGGGGGLAWTVETTDKTTATTKGYLMDTSGGTKTVTLHATPVVGDTVAIGDLKGTFHTNACTIARNSMLIHGQAEDLLLDVKNQKITLVYSGATDGWLVTELEPNAVMARNTILPAFSTADVGKSLTVIGDQTLGYKPNSIGRKNYLINGNFDIWQRATSQTSSGYGSADRWTAIHSGTTKTASRQTFTVGQTDVPGNPTYFYRTVVSSVAGAANFCQTGQLIENVASLSGSTATVSFWAKADSNKNIAVEFLQSMGTGGTPSAGVTGIGAQLVALTSSWKKFTITVTIPSISGKTLGTDANSKLVLYFWFNAGSDYAARAANLGQQSGTFDIAQVQLEEGDIATEFERRTYGDELQLCMRYYQSPPEMAFSSDVTVGGVYYLYIVLPVYMRTTPAATVTNTGALGFPAAAGSYATTSKGTYETRTANGTAAGGYFQTNWKLDAEL